MPIRLPVIWQLSVKLVTDQNVISILSEQMHGNNSNATQKSVRRNYFLIHKNDHTFNDHDK